MMQNKISDTLKMRIGKPYPLGVFVLNDELYFSVEMKNEGPKGIILSHKSTNEVIQILFLEENKIGNIFCGIINGLHFTDYEYNFFCNEKIFTDIYAKQIIGNEIWGDPKKSSLDYLFKANIRDDVFPWELDRPLKNPYEQSVFYCLHVRGYTKHTSSNVKHSGTFLGIVDKIHYLKDLGITAIVLMPSYEFNEVITKTSQSTDYFNKRYKKVDEIDNKNLSVNSKEDQLKLNYWGYIEGFYFAPKSSYSYGPDPVHEFKTLVKILHENKIEVIMQFYFSPEENHGFIQEVLRYWLMEYHIDGFHLLGDKIPITLLTTDPLLAETKIIYKYLDENVIEDYGYQKKNIYKNLSIAEEGFMYDSRKLLKGDEDQIYNFVENIRKNNDFYSYIHFITNYNGFTLMDLVSYEKKHNEANGEDNQDGNNYNYSWNCGAEGKTKKRAIVSLRKKQMKNAFILFLLTQGTPMIIAGDEFCNSSDGNNNPYCQDNDITWLNWNQKKAHSDMTQFVKDLILLKREHPILHCERQLRVMDTLGCGYPDISYHGSTAWRPDFDNSSRCVGVMYCGKYAKINKIEEDSFFYIAYNMHWLIHEFALPNLPKGKKWYRLIDTGRMDEVVEKKEELMTDSIARVVERSIQIFIGK